MPIITKEEEEKKKKKLAEVRTPEFIEEEKERKAGGKAFIKAREKAKGKGANDEEAMNIATAKTEGKKFGQVTVEEVRGKREEIGKSFEEEGVFKDQPTEVTPLYDPEAPELTSGQLLSDVSVLFAGAENAGLKLPKFMDIDTPLNIISKFMVRKGQEDIAKQYEFQTTSLANKFRGLGAELPTILGTDVGEATGILFGGDPEKKVQEFNSAMEPLKQMSSTAGADARSGDLTPEQAFKRLNSLDKIADELEERIQLEAMISQNLRTSGALVGAETDILELRQEIFSARQMVAGSILVNQEEVNPLDVAYRLQDLKGENKNA